MFCLGCGTEVSLRAGVCPVCGRQVAGAAGTGGTRVAPARPQESGAQPVITLMATSVAAQPLLEAPGFPRDTPGRVLLLTVIGLAADLLVPWSNVYGQREAMIHVGAPAVGLVLLFALAALPLVRPSFRREPLVGALPLVVGAFCAGVGMMYWVLLYRENEQASSIPASVPSGVSVDVSVPATTSVVIGPDIGLFLFLIGSGVLAVVGYQLFLAAGASRASGPVPGVAQVGHAVSLGASPTTVGGASVAAPVLAVAGTAADVAPGPGAGMSQALPERNGHSEQNGRMPGTLGATGIVALGAASGMQSAGATPPGEQGTLATAGGAGAQVVLPGSAAWNEAPQQPDVKRHAGGGGWPRAHGRLR